MRGGQQTAGHTARKSFTARLTVGGERKSRRKSELDKLLLAPAGLSRLTLRGAEVHGLRHGPHALGVAGLDLEVVGGVQRQLLDLVGQAVAHHRLDHPVVVLGVDVGAVVDDVPCRRRASDKPGRRQGLGTLPRTSGPLTRHLPVGLGGRLPVDDDGARLVLLAHHGHVFGRGAGD